MTPPPRLAAPRWTALGGFILLAACNHATDPTDQCFVAPPPGTHQSSLVAAGGCAGTCCTGGTSVTSLAMPEATFVATIRFVVNRARPNTVYTIQRAAEANGDPTNTDGICQLADGLPPYSAPVFTAFPIPWKPGPKITLTTDGQGDGSVEFEHRAAGIPRGRRFDVKMRLVDDEASPTSDLRSGCMTIVVN